MLLILDPGCTAAVHAHITYSAATSVTAAGVKMPTRAKKQWPARTVYLGRTMGVHRSSLSPTLTRTQTQTQTQTLVCVSRVRVTLATTPEWIPRDIIAMAIKDVG